MCKVHSGRDSRGDVQGSEVETAETAEMVENAPAGYAALIFARTVGCQRYLAFSMVKRPFSQSMETFLEACV